MVADRTLDGLQKLRDGERESAERRFRDARAAFEQARKRREDASMRLREHDAKRHSEAASRLLSSDQLIDERLSQSAWQERRRLLAKNVEEALRSEEAALAALSFAKQSMSRKTADAQVLERHRERRGASKKLDAERRRQDELEDLHRGG